MWILAFLIAAFIALGIACAIASYFVAKSNDHGDSKGTIHDFSRGTFRMMDRKDNIRKPRL